MTPPRINPSEIDVQLAEKSVLANGIALYTLPSADFERIPLPHNELTTFSL